MKGYIGITSHEWFAYLKTNHIQGEVNFWRKNTNQFKALDAGERFFFLVKNEKGIKTERAVLGCATFERFETNTVLEAWEKYDVGNGDPSFEAFTARMEKMFQTSLNDEMIGSIILSNVEVFSEPIYLSSVGIDFQNSIVSGKTISVYEAAHLYETACKTRYDIVKELEETYAVEDANSFPEGKKVWRQHLVSERNPKVIQLAKEQYKAKHGKLTCQVCDFDFEAVYGEIGEDYIEGHHTKPVSDMKPGEETKVEDIAMVCANCHRMLHRRRPWLSLEALSLLKR